MMNEQNKRNVTIDIPDIRELKNTRAFDDVLKVSESFKSLNGKFIRGRLVSDARAVPANSADVVATDRLGDIIFSATFIYTLIDNAGTPAWRRVALAAF
jgi:hypothetical protein